MADSCKLHLLASAWPWRGVAIRLQVEYPDGTRAREESDGKRRGKGRRRSDGEAKREKETESK